METKNYKIIGLMSGTSGDGLDIAFCQFDKQEEWSFNIKVAETVPFPLPLEKSLAHSHLLAGEELTYLDMLLVNGWGNMSNYFVKSMT